MNLPLIFIFDSFTILAERRNSLFTFVDSMNIDKRATARNRRNKMASNKTMVPEAKEALDKFKMEAANEVGVNLTQGYNGNLTSREAGSVGGQMVKKMVESYENSIKNSK